jgi:single-strand DNA-binding protein
MAARRGATQEEAGAEPLVGVNEVRLSGRVSGMPETRTLPSGDEVVQLRLVVRRPTESGPGRGSRAKSAEGKAAAARAAGEGARVAVDTLDVSCWTPATRRAALRLADGDLAEVQGSLRRRFYRAGASVQSRYDVMADTVRRATGRT